MTTIKTRRSVSVLAFILFLGEPAFSQEKKSNFKVKRILQDGPEGGFGGFGSFASLYGFTPAAVVGPAYATGVDVAGQIGGSFANFQSPRRNPTPIPDWGQVDDDEELADVFNLRRIPRNLKVTQDKIDAQSESGFTVDLTSSPNISTADLTSSPNISTADLTSFTNIFFDAVSAMLKHLSSGGYQIQGNGSLNLIELIQMIQQFVSSISTTTTTTPGPTGNGDTIATTSTSTEEPAESTTTTTPGPTGNGDPTSTTTEEPAESTTTTATSATVQL